MRCVSDHRSYLERRAALALGLVTGHPEASMGTRVHAEWIEPGPSGTLREPVGHGGRSVAMAVLPVVTARRLATDLAMPRRRSATDEALAGRSGTSDRATESVGERSDRPIIGEHVIRPRPSTVHSRPETG